MTTNILTVLSQLADELNEADEAVQEAERQLKAAKERFTDLAERTIPDLMDENGIQEFKTNKGFEISIAEKLVGNITKAKEQEAHQWLADNGFDSLLKNQFKLDFNKGEDDLAQEVERYLVEHGIAADRKRYIHPQTLHAFLREKLEDGEDIPLDLFGVYRKRTAKITKD
jgi:hypothetical protein